MFWLSDYKYRIVELEFKAKTHPMCHLKKIVIHYPINNNFVLKVQKGFER